MYYYLYVYSYFNSKELKNNKHDIETAEILIIFRVCIYEFVLRMFEEGVIERAGPPAVNVTKEQFCWYNIKMAVVDVDVDR